MYDFEMTKGQTVWVCPHRVTEHPAERTMLDWDDFYVMLDTTTSQPFTKVKRTYVFPTRREAFNFQTDRLQEKLTHMKLANPPSLTGED